MVLKHHPEQGVVRVDGWFWDEVYEKDPVTGEDVLVERSEPVHNTQMLASITLITGLLLGDSGFTGGILYHAQGSGNSAWDTGTIPTPSNTDTQLVAEAGRKVPDSIVYVQLTAGTSPGSAPTLPPAASSTLLVAFDGGSVQTVTFAGTETTPTLLAAAITGAVTGGSGVVNGSNVDIVSASTGPSSQVTVSGGTALTAIGQTAGTYNGSIVTLGPGIRGTALKATTTYAYGDLVGVTIREQALFGGNATATANSGFMVNELRQVGRFKSASIQLIRSVVLALSI